MNRILICLAVSLLAGCQTTPSSSAPKPRAAAAGEVGTVASLVGEYDNYEQVWQSHSGSVLPHVQHRLSLVGGKGNNANFLLWQVELSAGKTPINATWLYRIESSGTQRRLVPHRPLDASAVTAIVQGKPFLPVQWSELDSCSLVGESGKPDLVFSAQIDKCNAMLPGLGAGAALLPLHFSLSGEMLKVAVFADMAVGPDAHEQARRMRWFRGWGALNGAGPQAKADSKDWHMQRDLSVHSEGGRTPLRFRDGANSGYSLELSRVTYAESNTPVLKLALIEDAGGKTLVYVWANPDANRIGLNLGWVQIGLEQSESGSH